MFQFSNLFKMETRDHFKNGASLKSQTSKGNKMKKAFFLLVALISFGMSVNAQQTVIIQQNDGKTSVQREDSSEHPVVGNAELFVHTMN